MSVPRLKARQLKRLLYWMTERQRIYLRRQAGELFPWTADPILQRYRFCNTYREQDRETVWLRENWLKPYADHDNLWFAACMFRQINWSPTLAEIGFPDNWDPKRVLKIMEDRRRRGEKTYTSAYMLPEIGETSKPRYTVLRVLDPLYKLVQSGKEILPWYDGGNWEVSNCMLEKAHGWLNAFYGWGAFLAYEAVTDWRHTRYLDRASDIYNWANAGPGAKRGINRLLENDIRAPLSKSLCLDYMREVFQYIDAKRDSSILPTLEMRDVEHSLCEYFKYCRVEERLKESQVTGLEIFKPARVALI